MSVSIDDLQPKPFKIEVRGLELTCNPLTLAQLLVMAKMGQIFQKGLDADIDEIKLAEREVNEIFGEIIPEIKGRTLETSVMLEIIEKVMEETQPTDNKELKENKVQFNTDPKAQGIG